MKIFPKGAFFLCRTFRCEPFAVLIYSFKFRCLNSDKEKTHKLIRLDALIQNKNIFEGETEYLRLDGKSITVTYKMFLTKEKGKIITAVTDISKQKEVLKQIQSQNDEYFALFEEYKTQNEELKKSKKKSQENEKKYRAAFNTIPDPLSINTIEGIYTRINKAFTRVSGYHKHEIIGQNTKDINIWKHEKDRKQILEILKKEGNVSNFETVFRIKTGMLKNALVSATIIEINKKKFILTITKDITPIKQAKEKLTQKNKELALAKVKAEESDKLKSAFLANMSHEIRTPMNAILGFGQLMKEDEILTEERNEYIDIINNSGEHLLNLIDDIIDISKIDTNQLKVTESKFSLNEFLSEIYSFFQHQINQQKNGKVKLIFKTTLANTDDTIISDSTRLKQILVNIIGNAVKFTDSGTITLEYEVTKNNELLFKVKDTGIGISKKKLPDIFGRFRQVDDGTTRKYGGTGLGLAIAKACTKLLGGNIEAFSKFGEGSEFHFTIDYNPAGKNNTEQSNDKNIDPHNLFTGKKILLVEDDKYSMIILQKILKKTNAQFILAENGRQAVNICKDNTDTDIVLMDIQLPELNGLEATKEILKFSPNLPIISQTANAMSDDREKSLNAGCVDYIPKPIDKTKLLNMMVKYLF